VGKTTTRFFFSFPGGLTSPPAPGGPGRSKRDRVPFSRRLVTLLRARATAFLGAHRIEACSSASWPAPRRGRRQDRGSPSHRHQNRDHRQREQERRALVWRVRERSESVGGLTASGFCAGRYFVERGRRGGRGRWPRLQLLLDAQQRLYLATRSLRHGAPVLICRCGRRRRGRRWWCPRSRPSGAT
jgi:hypothetical protein